MTNWKEQEPTLAFEENLTALLFCIHGLHSQVIICLLLDDVTRKKLEQRVRGIERLILINVSSCFVRTLAGALIDSDVLED